MFFINNFNNINRDRVSAYLQYSSKYQNWDWQTGVRVSQVSSSADDVGTNMAMMNPNVAALQNTFNNADRSKSFNLLDLVFKVNIPLSDNLSVQGSGAIKERAPIYSELYSWFPLGVSAGLADGRNYIGNLDLDKETARKLDLGLVYQANGLVVAGSLFYSDIDDYILGTPSTNQAANNIAMMNNIQAPLQWNNTDATLAGIEGRLVGQLNEYWSVQGTFEYVRGKQTSPIDQDLYRLAPLNLNVRLDYQRNQWGWHASARSLGAQNKVAEQQNETPTAGYTVFNTGVDYQVNDQLTVTLMAENLLDKFYEDHLTGINRIAQTEVPRGAKIPGAGRNVGLSVQYQF
jgi:iron complex outermembrane receptor protein